jgi:hypothetical protein
MTNTTGTTERKTRTITLTGRPPVRIVEDDWPVVAQATGKAYEGEFEFQSNRTTRMAIRVRQHADGRTIVYATYDYDTRWQHERCRQYKAGEMFPVNGADAGRIGDTEPIIAAINRVASEMAGLVGDGPGGLSFRDLARECIADLPAVEL